MAKHDAQSRAKAARNEAYADRFKRRSPSERKALRAARTLVRENRWLVANGITPNPVRTTSKKRGRKT